MNPAAPAPSPPPPGWSRPAWLDLIDHALHDPRVRRDVLIALAMVLLSVVASAWLLAGTGVLLTLTGAAVGFSTRLATRRRPKPILPSPDGK